jgi:hypothetical protein
MKEIKKRDQERERGKRKEERGKRKEERGKRKEERGGTNLSEVRKGGKVLQRLQTKSNQRQGVQIDKPVSNSNYMG